MSSPALRQWILLSLLMLSPARQTNDLPARLKLILRANLAAENKLSAITLLLSELDEKTLPAIVRKHADACQVWAEQAERFLVPMNSPYYPGLLLTTPDPPPLLYVHGKPQQLALPQIAIVGSRKPTPAGKKIAMSFAADLCAAGYQITSGLAFGIDAASHEGALQSGKPTIAVLGTGVNVIYPKAHRHLAEAIVEQGALVSEFMPDTNAQAWHFPQRNRIISGMSHGVLVVEAALASGSLITARLAAEQGREVFVIPGSIHNRMSKGCHLLIRQGALLVESAREVLEELGSLLQWERQQLHQVDAVINGEERNGEERNGGVSNGGVSNGGVRKGEARSHEENSDLSEEQQGLLAQIAYNPLTVDELSLILNKDVAALYPLLLQLELQGLIECNAGAFVRSY